MNHPSSREWFFQQLVKDAFTIYLITWVVLFFLETGKPGIVSHYLSLPHALFPLFFLGVLWLSIAPQYEPAIKKNRAFPWWQMILISLFLFVVLILIIDASWALTLIIISATLATLWGGAFSYFKQDV